MVGPGDPEEGLSSLNDSRTVPLAVVAHSTLLLVARGGYFEVTLDLLLNSIPFLSFMPPNRIFLFCWEPFEQLMPLSLYDTLKNN